MRTAVIEELEILAARDKRICLMTADLGYGVLETFAERFPKRYFNVGISEQMMAAAAAGMALSGNIVFTYSIGNFNTVRCMEQIRNDICYHGANVKIISVGAGFSYGQLGMSHHATEDIAMMRALPGMSVLVPGDPEEARLAVDYAASVETPCYIRVAKRGEPVCYAKPADMDISKIQEVVSGWDAALLVSGPILREGIAASERLQQSGLSVAVYSVPCVKPLDRQTICQLAERYPLLVTVEEHQNIGGLGGAAAEVISGQPGSRARLYRMGLRDTYTSVVGSHDYLCEHYGMSARAMSDTVLKLLRENHENCHHRG